MIDEFGQARLADRLPYTEWDRKQEQDSDEDASGNQPGLMYWAEVVEIVETVEIVEIIVVLIERVEYFAVDRYWNCKCASIAQGGGRQAPSP